MTSRNLVMVGALVSLAVACGGKVGSIEGDGGSTHGDDASGGPDGPSVGPGNPIPLDASPTPGDDETDASPSSVFCTQGPGSGGGGSSSGSGPVCSLQLTETCSDGTSYAVICSCPVGTCNCTESAANSGSSGSGIPFGGCPGCGDPDQAWAACGFPH
jgi:hypothetical protein